MPNGPEDSGTLISRHDAGKIFDRAVDEVHRFVLRRFRGQVLDVEDIHFHFDSAVLMPDFGDCGQSLAQASASSSDGILDDRGLTPAERGRITGLAVLRAVYRHAEAHPDQKMLIAGHTDREGRDRYNLELSQLRAENVLCLLQGKRDEWVAICRRKHEVEDYQQILKWVDVIWGWGCDPGDVDNDLGPQTRGAVEIFQDSYNRGVAHMPDGFQASIKVDGIVGKQTWGAFFDVYMQVLRFICEVDDEGLQRLHRFMRLPQRFVDPGRLAVGCGENFPITANPVVPRRRLTREQREEQRRLAQVDRRVEIMFFDPGEEPIHLPKCHPRALQCVKDECEIYDQEFYELEPLPCEPIPAPVRTWVLRILKPPKPIKSGANAGDDAIPTRREPLAQEPYIVTGSGAGEIRGTTDGDGVLRVRVADDPCTMTLRIAGTEIRLNAGALPVMTADTQAVRHRLFNLGYGKDRFAEWDQATYVAALKRFKKDHGLPEDAAADEQTRAVLKREHGS